MNKIIRDQLNPFRKYGTSPFRVAVLHGGPGAPGSVAGLARELSTQAGIIEPFQSASTVDGQVTELDAMLEQETTSPVILIGHSWGAWLAYIYTARYPDKVSKLIMISSGPLEEKYAALLTENRNKRFTAAERSELVKLEQFMGIPLPVGQELVIKRFIELMEKVNSFDRIDSESTLIGFQPDIFKTVWEDAAALRKDNSLLEMAVNITCPVSIIHGYDDPHPWEGVVEPLKKLIPGLSFTILKNCGHEPWNEKHVRKEFFNLLKAEIQDA